MAIVAAFDWDIQIMAQLQLKNFEYQDLFSPEGLLRLDAAFLQQLKQDDLSLYTDLLAYRNQPEHTVIDTETSNMLIAVANHLERFFADLFAITEHVDQTNQQTIRLDPVFRYQSDFVQRVAKRHINDVTDSDFDALTQQLLPYIRQLNLESLELAVAVFSLDALANKEAQPELFNLARDWAVLALTTEKGQAFVKDWVAFRMPRKTDFEQLIDVDTIEHDGVQAKVIAGGQQRQRYGFDLTDDGMTRHQVMNQIHYCVYCHKNQGDFCSKGFPVKKKQPELGLKENPLGELLTGCPLEEKISEMHVLKRNGLVIAPLAMVMVDNPMCPATGHRICNDCMKACIYQKQEPVDIPQIETRVLRDVLALPWGVEIYDLLTRWNPLKRSQITTKSYNGKKILVMGMGPAGFTLAHYLLQDGFAVVGADGLKIEPIDDRLLNEPIERYSDLCENLSDRITTGFGGVAEYGITVRWDKNFLKLIYLSLMRKQHFVISGGVRFGGTLTLDKAWQVGFDHVAVAVGAGLPRELPIKNSLAPGMRQANDFLMALQLTGAAKESSIANLQVRLPAVVIGGGLTGVDAATEVQAYYIKQIEKIARRYFSLVDQQDEISVRSRFTDHDLHILDEYLLHYQLLVDAREQAENNDTEVDYQRLLKRFGGVSIVYRKRMQDSPAYRKNHEELAKALEEGLFYIEQMSPESVVLDDYGDCQALLCRSSVDNSEHCIAAKTILVATGAKPNVAYAFEHRDELPRNGFEYQRYQNDEQQLTKVTENRHVKSPQVAMFTGYEKNDKRVTFLGDTHPTFHGSVVKAIASAKRCYGHIAHLFDQQLGDESEYQQFAEMIAGGLTAKVVANTPISSGVHELVVQAPIAASQYAPGRFYRLQNFETDAQHINGTMLLSEGVAALAAPVMNHPDQLSFLVFDNGASSKILMRMQVGQRLALMGPSGVATKVPDTKETLLVVGGHYAIAHLRGLAPAMQAAGNRVIYVATQHCSQDDPLLTTMKSACDHVVICEQSGALEATLKTLDLSTVTRIMIIDPPDTLRKIKQMRGSWLDAAVADGALWYASVYGTMQCMLKGVCAQCLQWQVDPETGKRTKAVYACSWQDQPFEKIDIHNIEERQIQNRMQEKLTDLWLSSQLAQE